MREIEYRRSLDEYNRLRVRFAIEQGKVVHFVVQLECRWTTEWFPVVRYDSAHGFAHRDTMHPHRDAIKETLDLRDFDEALTFAIEDLSRHWRRYRQRYERWQTNR
jgi:hypothetical protein